MVMAMGKKQLETEKRAKNEDKKLCAEKDKSMQIKLPHNVEFI